ncbi:hypothetical protein L7F22_028971 [Adiantum nelumboides]|nr:hypothetical protein [Adiantum nelumboides]
MEASDRLWDIIGKEPAGTSTRETSSTFEQRNLKALGIIGEGLQDVFIHHIGSCTTAREAWVLLEKVFGTTSKTSKIMLFIEFFSLTKATDTTMSAHLSKFKSLQSQLAGINKDVEEDIKIAVLIKSISTIDEYSSLVTTLTNLPTPILAEVEASLLEEERRIHKKNKHFELQGAYLTQSKEGNKNIRPFYKGSSSKEPQRNTSFKDSKKGTVYTFCGKGNHTEESCFLKQRIKAMNVGVADSRDADEEKTASEEANLVHVEEEWAF